MVMNKQRAGKMCTWEAKAQGGIRRRRPHKTRSMTVKETLKQTKLEWEEARWSTNDRQEVHQNIIY